MSKWWNRIHNFIIDQERLDSELNWIKKVWYIILVITTSIYVFYNFSDLVSFTFLRSSMVRISYLLYGLFYYFCPYLIILKDLEFALLGTHKKYLEPLKK